jgi:hypothetical protein
MNLRTVTDRPSHLDISMFRRVKQVPLNVPFSLKSAAQDGFEDSELRIPQRCALKRPPCRQKSTIHAQQLTLICARDLDHLPSSLAYKRSNESDGTFGKTLTVKPCSNMVLTCAEISSKPKTSRRVSFGNEVYRQLLNVTAPPRSGTYREDNQGPGFGSESDFSEQMDEDDAVEYEEDEDEIPPFVRPYNQVSLQHQAQENEQTIEYDGLTVKPKLIVPEDTLKTSKILSASIEIAARESEEHPNRPGQILKMKSSGQWIEVGEDIVDLESLCAGNRSLLQSDTSELQSLRSILKSKNY